MKRFAPALLIRNHAMVTAEFLYWMPDHPALLQSFLWQTMDVAPEYPAISKFIDHWEKNIDARLHSVTVGSRPLLRGPQWRAVSSMLTLH